MEQESVALRILVAGNCTQCIQIIEEQGYPGQRAAALGCGKRRGHNFPSGSRFEGSLGEGIIRHYRSR
jgi:hypothetical protein